MPNTKKPKHCQLASDEFTGPWPTVTLSLNENDALTRHDHDIETSIPTFGRSKRKPGMDGWVDY